MPKQLQSPFAHQPERRFQCLGVFTCAWKWRTIAVTSWSLLALTGNVLCGTANERHALRHWGLGYTWGIARNGSMWGSPVTYQSVKLVILSKRGNVQLEEIQSLLRGSSGMKTDFSRCRRPCSRPNNKTGFGNKQRIASYRPRCGSGCPRKERRRGCSFPLWLRWHFSFRFSRKGG